MADDTTSSVTPFGGVGTWVSGQSSDTAGQQGDTQSSVTSLGGGGTWRPSSYPDMTPGVPPKPKGILDTSFRKVPSSESKDDSGGLWSGLWSGLVEGASRVAGEMDRAGGATPDIIMPKAVEGAYNLPGGSILGPIVQTGNAIASPIAREVARLAAGGTAAASEIVGSALPGGTQQQRAEGVHDVLTSLPVVTQGMPYVPPEYMPNIKPPSATTEAVGPFPKPTVDVSTLPQAESVFKPQFQAADTSTARFTPDFTTDFNANLDTYAKKTPAGAATRSTTDPVQSLIDTLRKTTGAPFDTIRSVQETDQNIQQALSAQYGAGNTDAVRQMRQILHDFRDQYENPSAGQVIGNTSDIQTFANARGNYATYSRMKEVQDIIDSTANLSGADRASAIKNRVGGFLSEPANTRGWNQAEIDAVNQATSGGAVANLVQNQLPRLVYGVASHSLGAGIPAAIGSSMLDEGVSRGLAAYRLQQLHDAMGVLGERMQQPGTVATPTPAPVIGSRALRYAPLISLLGTTNQDQPRTLLGGQVQ